MDSGLKKKRPKSSYACSAFTFAFIAQMQVVYFLSTYSKTGATWNETYTASFFALSIKQIRRYPAELLLLLPDVILKWMTWAVFKWEIYGPAFYMSPIFTEWFRLIGVIGFVALHVGFGVCLKLGIFIWASIAAAFPMIPEMFWLKLLAYLSSPERKHSKVFFDDSSYLGKAICFTVKNFLVLDITEVQASYGEDEGVYESRFLTIVKQNGEVVYGFDAVVFLFQQIIPFTRPIGWLLSMVPRGVSKTIGNCAFTLHRITEPSTFGVIIKNTKKFLKMGFRVISNVLAILVLIAIVGSVLHNSKPIQLPMPVPILRGLSSLRMNQSWGMFSPNAPTVSSMVFVKGIRADNSTIDFSRTKAIVNEEWDLKPSQIDLQIRDTDNLGDLTGNLRWRKTFSSLQIPRVGKAFGEYVCREYNRRNRAAKLKRVEIYQTHKFTLQLPENIKMEKPQQIGRVTC